VVREINGSTWADRQQLDNYKHLQADGTTVCGCGIYCGGVRRPPSSLAEARWSPVALK
jgi:hypothetical protein